MSWLLTLGSHRRVRSGDRYHLNDNDVSERQLWLLCENRRRWKQRLAVVWARNEQGSGGGEEQTVNCLKWAEREETRIKNRCLSLG